jgi:predicted secreted Zn-dependent protease
MMKSTLLTATLIAGMTLPAGAASLSKTYSYFSIGGNTLDEIEAELASRGPHVSASNRRHPGATQMEFTTRLSYSQTPGSCKIVSAQVSVNAKVILPRWRRSRKAEQDVRLIWDTLAADIKRHEESHVVIAKNHAREMEQALKAMDRQKDCRMAAAKAKDVTAKILARHDRAQMEFDRVEGKNFESRIMRLLRYRLEQIEAGRLPG